jgi:predicted RecA/RadA family phage recombinase
MKTQVQEGIALTLVAPYAVASGAMFKVGSILAVAQAAAANAATVVGVTEGVFTLAKLSTDVVTQGATLYWDDTNKRLTLTSAGNTKAGYAIAAAGNGVATVDCRLVPTI